MKIRILSKKTIIRFTITTYIFSSILALGFIGERNYRSNLIKYGYDLGGEKTIENIVEQIEGNPCGEILIQTQQQSFSLIDAKCLGG
ncbi:hypothetical protein KC675_02615 [Candidatus Dojkabacteria bacterium]|jgi:hypothetical protein|uniref:Uncharacterized protein n=1 Tax=Candidatus Dojkabacteria bacterium TaxID=2099670 RepID=A0A955I6N1_9BACT|nr:hypothetical protein [Candidatus Dojkabacteria bacterium]